jgi:hypothetical protein
MAGLLKDLELAIATGDRIKIDKFATRLREKN